MATFTDTTTPNLTDYTAFLTDVVAIPTVALPTSSEWIGYAFDMIMGMILVPPGATGITYCLAAYNGATHLQFSITPDQPGQTYFGTARGSSATGYGLNNPTTGLIQASNDESTGQTLSVPDWTKAMTAQDLDFYKTPYGRSFLQWQQSYGPNIWTLV